MAKLKCRCFINASYTKAFSKGTSAVKTFKPCPIHEPEYFALDTATKPKDGKEERE